MEKVETFATPTVSPRIRAAGKFPVQEPQFREMRLLSGWKIKNLKIWFFDQTLSKSRGSYAG